MELKVIANKKTIPCGDVTWSESEDSLGMELSFSMPFSYFDKQFKKTLNVGDPVTILIDKKKVLQGIITQTTLGGGEYRGYDFAFYLNKSTTIIQFKKASADEAITKLCKRFNVPLGSIPKMATTITKLYKNEAVADIILDILKKVRAETGKRYKIQMAGGKLNIIESGTKKIKPVYTDELGRECECTHACSISGTRSIENLRNSVTVAGSGEKSAQIKATVTDPASIKKYGLLSTVETEEKINAAKARNRAKNILKEQNKVQTSFTAEMPGNPDIRAGVRIYFNRPEAKVKGWYKVKSCTHTFSNGIYRVNCEMEN